MNYFELFDIPIQLSVKKHDLAKKFFELSRVYHPDYYIRDKPEVQAGMLEKSALLNNAFKTLQNEDETIRYVLQLKNLLEDEEKYELPPDFLMEVLEINEQLMDAADDPDLRQRLRETAENLQQTISVPVRDIIENYTEGVTSTEDLLKVKEYYFKKKYLERIRQQLNGKL